MVRCLWITSSVEFGHRSVGDHASVIDHEERVSEPARHLDVLFGQKQRDAELAIERKQGLADLVDDVRLDAFGRLVEQQHFRIDGERAGDRELLFLSAGQETGPAVEIDLQIGEHLEADLGYLRTTVVAREGPQQNVFANGELRKNSAPLRNVADPELGPEIGLRDELMFCPSMAISPTERSVSPMIVRIRVVLPTPLRPSTQRHLPSSIPNEKSFRIGVLP